MMRVWSLAGPSSIKTKDYYTPNQKERIDKKVSNDIYTLDLETSSLFYLDGEFKSFDYSRPPEEYQDIEKVSVPYIYMFGINDKVYYGREITELEQIFKDIYEEDIIKIIYIHNLSYEMQFLLNIFAGKYKIYNMVCRDIHKPIQFEVQELNLIFRCSYMLTNMTLENAALEYTDVEKKVGDLDYQKARSPLTKLSDTELGYCEYDIICLYKIILYFKEKYKNLYKIPLTSTSVVRKVLKKRIDYFYIRRQWDLVPSPSIYLKLMACFSGGYTHANILNSMRVWYRVTSKDEASAYPCVMVTEKLPQGEFLKCRVSDYTPKKQKYYAFMLYVRFEDVKPKYYNHYMQASKCINLKKPVIDNGRITKCDSCEMWLTDVDFEIIKQTYNFSYTIVELYKAKKGYLDVKVIKYILELYGGKTKLKQKAKRDPHIAEVYQSMKGQLNSLYGVSVSNILNNSSNFINGKWTQEEFSKEFVERKLEDSKKSWSTLFYYAHGVWITALARRNLFMNILKIDTDMIYADTDSIKYLNNHDDIFEEYNKQLIDKYKAVCKRYSDLKLSDFMPEDENGVKRPIGAYEDDGYYDKFVTMGAKKYAYEEEGKLHVTISGVNKKKGVSRLEGDINKFLEEDLTFDYNQSGRLIHYYLDNQPHFKFTDIDGNIYTSRYNYGIVLQPTTYTMGVTDKYIELLKLYERERAIKNGKQEKTICKTV